jgi:drug/metabolite transporter (DMT)-like permease
MILSCLAFAAMWVMIRYGARSMHSFELVFFRNLLGGLWLVPMLLANPGLVRPMDWRRHLRRATSGFIATGATFYAVAHAPLATVLSINYTAPLFATIAAVLFLGEALQWQRAAALLAGFAGMLLVVRPGHLPLTPGVLAAGLSAIATAFSVIAIRRLVAGDDSRAVASWTFILTTPPSLVLALFVWRWPQWADVPLLLGIGAMAALGQIAFSRAFALSEASAVLPYDFVRFVCVTCAGVLLFSEHYDALTLIGGAVILASTVFLAVRDAQARRG